MANSEHVELVKHGAEVIRQWKETHPGKVFDLIGADLRGADLRRADLCGAELMGADLSGGILNAADLRGDILKNANLSEADLSSADLRGVNLSFANLSRATLASANLKVANLNRADLCEAYLGEASLVGANLSGADLSRADLSGANLGTANLRRASFCGADLSRSDLRGANFSEADLREANLSWAILGYTTFANVDLSVAIGLDSVQSQGPSSIGIDTLLKSGEKIPDAFLRGCGVPVSLITYLPSLIGSQQAIQFYSCFISYSSQDEEFCKRLHARMQQEHLRVWFAPEDIQGGKKIHEQIDEAIRLHDKLLLVLTEHSMNSEWVRTEVRKARRREVKEGKRVLFPIRLVPFDRLRDWEAFDADTGKDMAVEVREYFIPDFSNWKDHDAFEAAFARLLNDLKNAA